jgi:hypothetical protein
MAGNALTRPTDPVAPRSRCKRRREYQQWCDDELHRELEHAPERNDAVRASAPDARG